MPDTRTYADRRETRDNLVEVAARLLREQGAAAVTTRAVAEAAGVQAPTIYRLFGDKDGLLDAAAEHVVASMSPIRRSRRPAATRSRTCERHGTRMSASASQANERPAPVMSAAPRERR